MQYAMPVNCQLYYTAMYERSKIKCSQKFRQSSYDAGRPMPA